MTTSHHERANTSAMSQPKLPMLKLTILNLSGIRIGRDTNSSHNRGSTSFDNFATSHSTDSSVPDHYSITASVTFTGSCDPSDMRVVSSALCSTSGRLLVESRPVVVPVGIANGLIAAWDDSSETLTIPRDRSLHYDNVLAKSKGFINAIPQALPHVFVRLNELKCASPLKTLFSTRELMNIESTLGLSTISSLSEGPELDDTELRTLADDDRNDKEDLEMQSILRQNNDISKCCSKTVDLTVDQSDQSNRDGQTYHESLCTEDSFNHRNNLMVVNTPSQSDESATIPEILEMQVALHINEVPHQTDHEEYLEYDEKITVKSACLPCSDGGGTVAHLVLFNDFLLNEMEEGFRENGRDIEDGGIVVLPVRKRTSPLYRGVPSISCHSNKLIQESNGATSQQLCSPLSHNNEIWVDLEDDATISVRLERCTVEDDPFRDREVDQDLHKKESPNVSLLKTTGKVNSNPQTPSRDQETFQPADFVKNSNFFKQNTLTRTAAFSSQNKCLDGMNYANHDEDDRLSDKAQPDLTGSYVGSKCIVSHKDTKGVKSTILGDASKLKMAMKPPRMMCAPALDFDGLLKTITNLVSHCGDDVQGYDIHGVMSMDSTIHTSGSI